jgi:hypothetical protein
LSKKEERAKYKMTRRKRETDGHAVSIHTEPKDNRKGIFLARAQLERRWYTLDGEKEVG